jgi:hypothetical protein
MMLYIGMAVMGCIYSSQKLVFNILISPFKSIFARIKKPFPYSGMYFIFEISAVSSPYSG